MNIPALIDKALDARLKAYTPYSGFKVGAALLTADGTIYQGCNIENAGLTPGNCAERTAFFKAVSEGITAFQAIAVVGAPQGHLPSDDGMDYCYPCGVCRQVMREFVVPTDFQIIVARDRDDYQTYTLEDLLPHAFGPDYLD